MINCLKSRLFLAAAVAAITQFTAPILLHAQQETPTGIVAAQLRRQGFPCTAPQSAVQDRKRSTPNAVVWRLQCAEGSYRVTLVPNMEAKVERTQEDEE